MDLNHVPQCKKCDYDLTGLKDIGTCPECGQFYNRRTGEGVTKPLTASQKGDLLLHRLRTYFLAGMTSLALLCFLALALMQWSAGPLWWGLVIVPVLGLMTLVSWVYEGDL